MKTFPPSLNIARIQVSMLVTFPAFPALIRKQKAWTS